MLKIPKYNFMIKSRGNYKIRINWTPANRNDVQMMLLKYSIWIFKKELKVVTFVIALFKNFPYF